MIELGESLRMVGTRMEDCASDGVINHVDNNLWTPIEIITTDQIKEQIKDGFLAIDRIYDWYSECLRDTIYYYNAKEMMSDMMEDLND